MSNYFLINEKTFITERLPWFKPTVINVLIQLGLVVATGLSVTFNVSSESYMVGTLIVLHEWMTGDNILS